MFNFLPRFGKRSGRIMLGTVLCLAVSFAIGLSTPTLAAEEAAAAADTPKVETPPDVARGEASKIQSDSAAINFKVRSEGDEKDLIVMVYYGTEDGGEEPGKWTSKTERVFPDKLRAKNEYTVILRDLEPETNYFYRIQAQIGDEITWSEPGEFLTAQSGLPFHITLGIFLGIIAAFVVPFWIGAQIAKRVRMPDYGWRIGVIFCSLIFAIIITVTGWPPSLGIDLSGGVILVYELEDKEAVLEDQKAEEAKAQEGKEEEEQQLDSELGRKETMKKLLTAVAMRVNPGGTREVSIRQYGPAQIEITVPRASEEKVKRIEEKISRAGTLEFRILANRHDHADLIEKAMVSSDTNEIWNEDGTRAAWWVPVNKNREDDFHFNQDIATRTANFDGVPMLEVLVVNDVFNVTGEFLSRAMPHVDEYGRPCVSFQFNTKGAKRFGVLTGNNVPVEGAQPYKRQLGIVLDGYLYSAPTINSRITDNGIISGSFTNEQVQDLVDVLNAGSLPAALKKNPISKLSIGPTLGRDTVERGKIAISISVVLVLVFMAIYYRFAGLVACGALLMNIILLLGVMIGINADFTLPGIAGLVLTVGMAVDANVLIYERIREELDRGAALRMAIRNGFGKATTTIIDANVTTLITAVILFIVGTQQLKGFAVTLFLGITLSMFTAVFCARVVFDIAERRRIITKLSMMRIIGKTNINFVGIQKIGIAASIILILIGIVAVSVRGKGILDIDFTGGESVTLLFKEQQNIGDIRADLSKVLPDLTVSDTQLEGQTPRTQFMINTSLEVDANDPTNKGLSATEVVEKKLFDIYGDKLATNNLESGLVVPLNAEGQPTSQPEAAEPSATPEAENAEPSATSSSESTAMADDEEAKPDVQEPAAEAKPETSVETPATAESPNADQPPSATEVPAEQPKAEETPAETAPAEQPKAEEEAPAKETPAEEKGAAPAPVLVTNRFANGAMAQLVLAESMDHDTLSEIIGELLTDAKASAAAFDLTNTEYEPGDTGGYTEWTLRTALPADQVEAKIVQPLREKLGDMPVFPSSSSIGGRVAGDMKKAGILAIIASLICIIGYIWIRFQHVVFGLAAVVALVHDVLITLGAIALSAYVASALGFLMIDEFKIGLTVLAALLTIIGYSLNDTIVVFDRIREIRGKSPHLTGDMINTSINQTLSRTLLTSFTTFIVVLVLYIGGGSGIHAFAFTLIVGLIVGTYSSIFIASPILLWMSRGDHAPTKK